MSSSETELDKLAAYKLKLVALRHYYPPYTPQITDYKRDFILWVFNNAFLHPWAIVTILRSSNHSQRHQQSPNILPDSTRLPSIYFPFRRPIIQKPSSPAQSRSVQNKIEIIGLAVGGHTYQRQRRQYCSWSKHWPNSQQAPSIHSSENRRGRFSGLRTVRGLPHRRSPRLKIGRPRAG